MQQEPFNEQKLQDLPQKANQIFNLTSLRSITSQFQEFLSIALSLDEKVLATGMYNSFIRIWNTETWEYKEIFQEFISLKIVFSNDLMITAGRNKQLKVWSYKDNFTKESRRNLQLTQMSQIKDMAVSTDSKYLVSINSNVIFWDLEKGIAKYHLSERKPNFIQCKIVNQDRIALLGIENGELQLWNLKNCRIIRKLRPNNSNMKSFQVSKQFILSINNNLYFLNWTSGKIQKKMINDNNEVNYSIPYLICNDLEKIQIINTQSQQIQRIKVDNCKLINGIIGIQKKIMVFYSNEQLLVYEYNVN